MNDFGKKGHIILLHWWTPLHIDIKKQIERSYISHIYCTRDDNSEWEIGTGLDSISHTE